ADLVEAGPMSLMEAVAEIESEDIDPGLEQGADRLRRRRRGPERRDDFRFAKTSHAGGTLAGRNAVRKLSFAALHQDGAEVIHIGASRPGHDEIAERCKESVTIVVGKSAPRVDSERCAACETVGAEDGAGVVLGAVDAVGIAGDGVDAGRAVQRYREGQQKLGVAAA